MTAAGKGMSRVERLRDDVSELPMTGCLVARVAIHEHRAETEFSDLQAAGSALLCALHEMGAGRGAAGV